jgi:hypothetical protein
MLSRVRGAKDSDMSKSTKTVVYFDWKTVIYIYVCGKCRTQFMLPMEKSVTFTGACANEIIPSINRSFVCKAKEERHVRICDKVCQWLAEGRWFSPVSSSNAIDRHDITEILLKVALNTINLTSYPVSQMSTTLQLIPAENHVLNTNKWVISRRNNMYI